MEEVVGLRGGENQLHGAGDTVILLERLCWAQLNGSLIY